MLDILAKFNLYTHIIAGSVTLITGPFAIFYNFRDPGRHRLVGKVFFYAMLVVVFSAIISFFRHPEQLFAQFLLGISLLVLAGILRGVRAIFLMKGSPVLPIDWVYTLLLGLNALWMLGMSAWHFAAGTMVAFPILFGVFGLMSLGDVRLNWRVFRNPQSLQRLDWMRLHLGTMLGAFTASTTAFTVNAAPFLPWWAQWFGPTLVLLPLQFYFGRKVAAMRSRALVKSEAA